ncbi:HNH endonuclease [Paenibacillus validus]|uniref:HNH endonuclease n=1 Tax=Paenibacillus chartarius TaxID=747481 RepID=A0ABV6DFM5_9BACL|nr:HNH endonuclease [Paenibacillus validus]MED4600021.1 HNH endonuclease [Paenibacillus validus]MED4605712.1 HNH endonuclease [Paenibacillus validus]
MNHGQHHYAELSSIFYPHDITGADKDLVGDNSKTTCLFCGQSRPNVTFKKDAHVIPAGLGNRTLFYLNECDTCNTRFSYYENELVNFLTFDRIFISAQKRPGSGAPKYKQKGKQSALEMNSGKLNIAILEQEGIFNVAEKEGQNIITFKINNPPPYRPEDICKCLTHMGWALLEDEDKTLVSYVPNWLLGKIDIYPLYLDTAFVPGNGFANVILEVLKTTHADSINYPYLIRFTYGTKIISFYLPASPDIKCAPLLYSYCPHIPENAAVSPTTWTIPSNERIKPDDITYTWSYRDKDPRTDIKV